MKPRLHGWLRTAEAALALVAARALVRFVPLSVWHDWFAAPEPAGSPTPDDAMVRHRAAATDRAAGRLPGRSPCLSRALAMALMLRRRGFASRLVIGVRRPDLRDGHEDLHAWLQHSGRAIYGERSNDKALSSVGKS